MSAGETVSRTKLSSVGLAAEGAARASAWVRSHESRVLFGFFLAVLALHAWYATRNFGTPFMPGHEFRQAQTAITSYYIDRQDNFGLLYETPIVGKPWVSILMEVPLYEWSVVAMSREFGVAHFLAARGISLACFYLTLPAFFLLLGRLGLPPARRGLVLAAILACPVYIFYSRAFLMESMELMACAWFLYGYVRMIDERRWHWFVLASAAGTVAALVKSATFAIWLLPPAAWTAARLWREWRRGAGAREWGQTIFWGLAGVTIPLGALRLWIELTDPLKAAHASAWIFTAGNLSAGNWGLTDLPARFSTKIWALLFDDWRQAILPPWLLLSLLGAGIVALPRVRGPVLGLAAFFFAAQLLFPFAYAYQDYYFYACAAFVAAALGWLAHGVLDSPAPRWLAWPLALVPIVGGFATYHRGYLPQQLVRSEGGFAFTRALRDFLPPDSVIVGAGADWSAVIPLYSQRRALMVRNGLVNDPAYLDRAFADLAGEDVGALVLFQDQRGNRALVARAARAFRLDELPSFSDDRADVYLNLRYRDAIKDRLAKAGNYGMTNPPAGPIPGQDQAFAVSVSAARALFPGISPGPIRAHFKKGLGYVWVDDKQVVFAHPDSDLWLRAPAGATQVAWNFGVLPEAYERRDGRTDGVEFTLSVRAPGEPERIVYRRVLDPAREPADRGMQRALIAHRAQPGEFLRFATRPGRSEAFDWAYWSRIEVK